MDMHYALKLAECYKELHQKLKEASSEIDWPVCVDPGQRSIEFLQFISRINEGRDEWATYYGDIAVGLEHLLWLSAPEDKTKV